MNVIGTTLLVTVTLGSFAIPHAQGRPDFSGTWKMDPSRSVSAAQSQPLGPVTVVIAQTGDELRLETTLESKTAAVTYRLNGMETAIPGGSARTRWEGQTLVTELVRHVNGKAVTTREVRTLSADGNEMHVESTLVIQHGYSLGSTTPTGMGTDVYVRQAERR